MHHTTSQSMAARPLMSVVAAAVAALFAGQATAAKFDVGNADTEVRFDNTVKYNAGWRVQERDKAMGDTWTLQAGEYKFDKGDMVTNRVDLLTEIDVVYKNYYGLRVSGAAWKDAAYDSNVTGNPAYQAAGLGTAYPNNQFPRTVSRYYTQSGELLDAFVFGRIDFGDMPLSLKAGKHTLYWGESLFTPIHGVSYSQGPLDFQKAVATPGIEAKELFRPTDQISAHLQINPKISVAAQYQLEWKPTRIYEGGTYINAADPLFQAGTSFAPNGVLPYLGNLQNGPDAIPRNRGNYGVMMKAQSDLIDGTVGLYLRKFDDVGAAIVSTNGLFADLHNAYAKNVKLVGISLAKSIAGMAVGAELVHRQNTALATNFGAAQIARGDTWSGLLNTVAYLGKNPVFDSATLLAELTYSRLDKVYGSSLAFFNSCNLTGAKRESGCATKDAAGISATFTPTWFQALPAVDLTLPIHYDRGLMGNSPIPGGGTKNDGTWSDGLGADYQAKYKFDLAYHGYFGEYATSANPYANVPGIGPLQASGSANGTLKDRGWVSLTVKTTF